MSVSSLSVRTKLKYKLILLGDQGVGKTCLIQRFVNGKFQDSQAPTVGIDFVVTNMHHKGRHYRLQLWDTAGQERFKSLIPSYLRDSHCALILYDVTNKQSFQNISKWLQLYQQSAEQNSFVIIVANKSDLKCKYQFIHGNRFTPDPQLLHKFKQQGIQIFEVSAKSGMNVNQLFHRVIELIQQKNNKPILDDKILETVDMAIMSTQKDITHTIDGATKLKLTVSSQKPIDNEQNQRVKKRCC